MPDDNRILWILGAGASKHLGLPLLYEFRAFIDKVANHPNNQGPKDAEDRSASFRTAQRLSERGINDNIEELLKRYPKNMNKGKDARRCIRWCFEKRHYAKMHKVDKPYKYKAYAYFLCCVKPGDTIVNFNYDLAIERTFFNAKRSETEHCKQPRIPEPCLENLKQRDYQLAGVNDGGSDGVELVKIHGSLSFHETCGKLVVGSERHEAVDEPYIVYPEPSKPSMQDGPGKPLLDAALKSLGGTQRIVIVGYSLPESDAEGHPFVSKLCKTDKEKKVVIVSPKPTDRLLELVKQANKAVVWVDKFERVFSNEHVRSFGQVIGREPELSS